MKKTLLFSALCFSLVTMAQQQVTGIVLDESTSKPIPGILVSLSGTQLMTFTDHEGKFSLKATDQKVILTLSGKNYESRTIHVQIPLQKSLSLYLSPKMIEIEQVNLSTGYQKIPKERAVGSFSFVDRQLLQKQVTTNIIDRLPAIANGLSVTKGLTENGQLMIRGLSSINGPTMPLIVVDNFPYDGDINNINPNMVESVSILKDASAASIWGARAANGVIVITTKGARFNQPISIEFTSNITIAEKPNLRDSRQIGSSDFIDMEIALFNQGYYNSDINAADHPALSPVIDLLNREKKGIVSHEDAYSEINRLRKLDVRDQYKKYMYTPTANRQYAFNISGGSHNILWSSFIGFDHNTGSLGETYQRLNARLQNTWRPSDKWSISTGAYFTNSQTQSGRSAYNSITMRGNWKIPYAEFADANGNPLIASSLFDQNYKNGLIGKGLLDWNYYPLTDWMHDTTKKDNTEIILNASANYKIVKGLEAEIQYQYQQLNGESNVLRDEESYYTRNYINTFTQKNQNGTLSFPVPKGAILNKGNIKSAINNVRGQINYNKLVGKHNINAIMGGEVRETITTYEDNRYYGYNPYKLSVGAVDYTTQYPNYVTGGKSFIQKDMSLGKTNIRFVSLYGNAAYTYDNRYTLSASVRRDASNLFGLKTNDQWNPFWSTGIAWNINKEGFYNSDWLPNLKLRGTYGFNGNIDPAMVAATTIIYDPTVSVYTGTSTARIDKFYNPLLRWETIRMINLGVDLATRNNRIAGSVEVYQKKGNNLFGEAPLDYTTGITSMIWNVAGMKGKGLDVELKTKNIDKVFKWYSILNYSRYRDEVTAYYLKNNSASNFVTQAGNMAPASGIVGLPVFSVFAYKWAGLDPGTGDPQGYLNGIISNDYSKIIGSEKGIEDLNYFGSAIPTTFGSFMNKFSYRNLSLDVGITYKLGYWFRRSSINYTDLILNMDGHSDYSSRWQKPGDELITNVPSNPYVSNSARDNFYNGSSVLIDKGDHIRLQYITLGYDFSKELLKTLPLNNLQLYSNINNIGILWKANNIGTDPDYNWGTYSIKPVTTYSLGLRAQF